MFERNLESRKRNLTEIRQNDRFLVINRFELVGNGSDNFKALIDAQIEIIGGYYELKATLSPIEIVDALDVC